MADEDAKDLYPPDPEGGQGGRITIDPHHTREHLAIIERMIRAGTLTPEDQREVRDEALVLMRKTQKPREKAAALRVLGMLERTDILKIKVAIDSAKTPAAALHLHKHEHEHSHVHGGRELPGELSVEELRKLIALDEAGQGRGEGNDTGETHGAGSPPQWDDPDALQDRGES